MRTNSGAKVQINETFPWREMFHGYAEKYQTSLFLVFLYFSSFYQKLFAIPDIYSFPQLTIVFNSKST
jgi:hypothetical protein